MNGKTDVKALKRVLSGNLPSTVNHVGSVIYTLDEAIMIALSYITNIPIDHFDTKKSAVNYGAEPTQSLQLRPTFNWDEMVVNTQQEINIALHELTTRADLGNSFAVLYCEGDELELGQSIVV
ncbi:hypothetical protein PENSUB_13871 [Penicillium subrubescens]|uniref:Uncharacterized protein n=1 Tax=Penicillium subrubescens TaxID=1316194 RepID=A0A1Q5UQ72_9EURO|nr:hypothetical protein PENSUB_13871 [Penicillium subrubescens]